MQRQSLRIILVFALAFASCKGATVETQKAPPDKNADSEADESSAVSEENPDGDLLQVNESQDTAVTPILVTGTYLTCVDVPVSRSYDYQERGRIVGCHLLDRETGKQVPMERVASDWFWQVDVPFGVIAHQQVVDDERALYPLLLELNGLSKEGRDILETMVKVTLDLLIPVENPLSNVLSLVLEEVLKPIPIVDLEEQLIPPEVSTQQPIDNPQSSDALPQQTQPQPQQTQPQQTQPQQTPVETVQEDEQPADDQQQPNVPDGPGDEEEMVTPNTLDNPSEGTDMPSEVAVQFAFVSLPGGATLTMTPQSPRGLSITDEVFRITGHIISQALPATDEALLFKWSYPIEVSFRLGGKVTCRAEGSVGTTMREITAKCQ